MARSIAAANAAARARRAAAEDEVEVTPEAVQAYLAGVRAQEAPCYDYGSRGKPKHRRPYR